jgi:surface antigen
MPKRLTVALAAAVLLSAGVSTAVRAEDSRNVTNGWQCAQFARLFSGIQIFGDAWTWWQQAVGKYARGSAPEVGAVLVFKPHGAMRLGHVAVVSQVVTDRVIQVTHANWSLIGGERGQVEKDVTVVDVSADNDWSSVKVWNNPTKDLGTTIYPTYGFVYGGTAQSVSLAANKPTAPTAKVASSTPAKAKPAANGDDLIARLAAAVIPGEHAAH